MTEAYNPEYRRLDAIHATLLRIADTLAQLLAATEVKRGK